MAKADREALVGRASLVGRGPTVGRRATRWSRRAAGALAGSVLLGGLGLALGAGGGTPGPAGAVTVNLAAQPAFADPGCDNGATPAFDNPGSGDAADPQVVEDNGTYYAFSTGNALGNYLAVVVSSAPDSGYHSYTGLCYGSTALPAVPAWQTANTETSPGVFFYGGHWVMFYDAAYQGFSSDTGHDCLGVATASSLNPPVFTDVGTPLLCQPTGSIDPSPFVDPHTGQAYLVWKQNDGGSSQPAYIWSQPLNADGTGFAFMSQPSLLLFNNTSAYPWETTVENPSMAVANGTFQLLFSAGVYTSPGYSEAITTCSGPSGPCGVNTPILGSYGSVLGPGGGALFSDAAGNWWIDYAAWQGGSGGCTSYSCGAARRLFVAPITLANPNPQVPCSAPASPTGYRFVASDGGIFSYGNLPFCGSMGGQPLNRPVVAMAATPRGGGYWEVASDGGIFSFGDAGFFGSMGGQPLNQPIVGMTRTPDGAGYWIVASDGGIFSFGDAGFFGSTGGLPLNRPIVAMAATPDGAGYWLVASDGGVFAFGDAGFFGSTGGLALNRPIVGMAPTGDGGGYWLVASDGGIFAFGDAAFDGSTGALALNQPIVGMATTPGGGGYWLVASDGGIFAFGDAAFYGSMGGQPLNRPIVGMAD